MPLAHPSSLGGVGGDDDDDDEDDDDEEEGRAPAPEG